MSVLKSDKMQQNVHKKIKWPKVVKNGRKRYQMGFK